MEKRLLVTILIFSCIFSTWAYPSNRITKQFVLTEEDIDYAFPQSNYGDEEDDMDHSTYGIVNTEDEDNGDYREDDKNQETYKLVNAEGEDDQGNEENIMDQDDNEYVIAEDEDFQSNDDKSALGLQQSSSSQDHKKEDKNIEEIIERNVRRDERAGNIVKKKAQKLLDKAKQDEKNEGKKPKDLKKLLKEAKEGKKRAEKKQPRNKVKKEKKKKGKRQRRKKVKKYKKKAGKRPHRKGVQKKGRGRKRPRREAKERKQKEKRAGNM